MAKVANTEALEKLVPTPAMLPPNLDPDGSHVLRYHLLHSDDKFVRSFWLCKVVGSQMPAELVLDINVKKWNEFSKLLTEFNDEN
jgi:hypothetical protein